MSSQSLYPKLPGVFEHGIFYGLPITVIIADQGSISKKTIKMVTDNLPNEATKRKWNIRWSYTSSKLINYFI